MFTNYRVPIGIDFGTTDSYVAIGVKLPHGMIFEVINNRIGIKNTPSFATFTENEEVLVGQPAKLNMTN